MGGGGIGVLVAGAVVDDVAVAAAAAVAVPVLPALPLMVTDPLPQANTNMPASTEMTMPRSAVRRLFMSCSFRMEA